MEGTTGLEPATSAVTVSFRNPVCEVLKLCQPYGNT
jgi:hypothetical protein